MHARLGWLILLVGLVPTSAALACGEWTLQDDERGHSVQFYIRSTRLEVPARGSEMPPPPNRILVMEGDSAEQLHTELGGRRQLTVVDGRLQLYGKTVGALREDQLTIGRTAYRIAVAPSPNAAASPESFEGRWLVEVRRGEKLVAHGRAMAMCLGGVQLRTDQTQVLEVRRRVTFYLAWRELIASRPPAKKSAAGSAP